MAVMFASILLTACSSEASDDCIRVQRELYAAVDIGSKLSELVRFLENQGWKYGHDESSGILSVDLKMDTTAGGEAHWVKIHIKSRSGVITSIQVQDFYESL